MKTMDTLTKVCEKILIYIRKILCEKLNRLNGSMCTLFNVSTITLIILKKLFVKCLI